jgi:glycine cleavage system transcriptional repressor
VRHFAVSAVGRDRPGIVAEVTRVLLKHGANIEDSQMGILRGHFTMMLIVSAPGDVESELEADLQGAAGALGLETIGVSEVQELEPPVGPPSHVVTVYGADHPGIVHAVASALAARGVNITDLQTRLLDPDEGAEPIYVLIVEAAVPAEVDPGTLETLLEEVSRDQNVEVSARPLEVEAL